MAQEKLQIKDQLGNTLFEAREDGILIRKMTTSDRNAVTGLDAGDNGLLVYDSDTKSLWIWVDAGWVEIDGTDLVDDADADPTNEIETWGTLNGIPIGFLDGTDDVNDADSDPTNEIETWSTLQGKPSGFADGIDDVNDADADPTNEIDTWSTLQGKPDGFADGIDDVNDADSDPNNEKETWSTLPGIPAGFSDGVDNVNDADADPANERNMSMTLDGTMLKLTDSGGTISTQLSSLVDDGDWVKTEGKVFNSTDTVGIGTDDPDARLHVKGTAGAGQHLMVIENTNADGNGLQIKIDGSHPLFVTGEGNNPDFFVTHPGSAIMDVFEPLADDIRNYLLTNGSINISEIDFSTIASPGGLLDQLGLVDLVSGGICKGVETLVALANGALPDEIQLPNLPLDGLPADLPNIPPIPTLGTISNFTLVTPNPEVWIPFPVSDYVTINIPDISFPTSVLNTPINSFNTLIGSANTGITTVNNGLETSYDFITGGLMAIDNLSIPLPQLQVPDHIGPITCPDPNPWDSFSFSFESLNPADYNIVNSLTSENSFITFTDQYDNKLGAITAQGLGEFSQDYFNQEKVLEIGGHITGMFSDDGNVVENLTKLGKEAMAYYKATDKIGVLYESGHGDYAEWLEREDVNERIGYGDIVGVRGGRISLSLEDAEQVMVISRAPIVLGNTPPAGLEKNGNNVAFIGQVPVKVMGPVHTGDFIVANPQMPGYGVAVPSDDITSEQLALAVGKSWETNMAPGFKFVNTIVGMHNHGWAAPMSKLQQRVEKQEATIQTLSDRLDRLELSNTVASSNRRKS